MSGPDPYRAHQGAPPPEPRGRIEDDGLDAGAFARRMKKREQIEAQASERRADDAQRRTRLAALGVFVLSTFMLVGQITRGRMGLVVLLGAAMGAAGFALVAGTGGAESVREAPAWVQTGLAISAMAGAACLGLLVLWL